MNDVTVLQNRTKFLAYLQLCPYPHPRHLQFAMTLGFSGRQWIMAGIVDPHE